MFYIKIILMMMRLFETSLKEKRAILTKDRGILKRGEVTHGYWVRSTKVEEQVKGSAEKIRSSNRN